MTLVATSGHPQSNLFGLIVLLAVLAGVLRYFFGPGRVSVAHRRRDAQRRFNAAQRREIMQRAGHRCEGVILGIRCRRTSDLHADHVIPWAAGGPTTVENGQALCRDCNREKSNRVPSSRQVRRLGERRTRY